MINKTLDSFSSFLLDPSNHNRSSAGKGLAWTTTIILGVGTFGIAQGLSAAWRAFRPLEKNDTHEAIDRLFHSLFGSKETSGAGDGSGPTTEIHRIDKNEDEKALSLHEVAKNVYNQRDILWAQAVNETLEDGDSLEIFIDKIDEQFQANGCTLSGIADDPKALKQMFQSKKLRVAVLRYAAVKKDQKLLSKHLLWVVNDIYERRDEVTAGAFVEGVDLSKLVNLIRKAFHEEGRSLSEVIKNNEAFQVLGQSGRLTLAIKFYIQAIKERTKPKVDDSKIPHFQVDNAAQHDAIRKRDARKLGEKYGKGEGLVTALNLNEFEDNPDALRKEVRREMLKLHPDRNPDADPELADKARKLFELLTKGVYEEYQDALKKGREK